MTTSILFVHQIGGKKDTASLAEQLGTREPPDAALLLQRTRASQNIEYGHLLLMRMIKGNAGQV